VKTIRILWKDASTGWFNYNWNGVITPDSVVHISVSEAILPSGGSIFGGADFGRIRHRGAAPIWVKNVRPHGPNAGDTITGGVEFYAQIDWGVPLHIVTDITVLDPPVATDSVG
jgi:hypothetical protein